MDWIPDISWTSVRKGIIQTAVTVLDPRLAVASLAEKSRILLEKGLTQEEVDLVISMFTSSSGNGKIVERVIIERQSNPLGSLLSGQLASNGHFLGRLTNLTLSAATWSVMLYGSYKVYENITKRLNKTELNKTELNKTETTMGLISQQLVKQKILEEVEEESENDNLSVDNGDVQSLNDGSNEKAVEEI